MRIVLVGASGLIGSAILARLGLEGHELTAIARRTRVGRQGVSWLGLNLKQATSVDQWTPHLTGIDAVIYCAGVLQDSPTDSTSAVHAQAPAALFAACERAGVKRVIYFSAMGAEKESLSAFSATKRQGEEALEASSLDWVILRPSVVIGRQAYGGSALFRSLASLPVVPRIENAGRLQVVQLDDVVETVVRLLPEGAPSRISLDLAGPEPLTFNEVVAQFRRWFGRAPAREIVLPPALLDFGYWMGDVAGWLGWRPPMRSTARREMVRGAVGDPTGWMKVTGIEPRSLEQALTAEPVSIQERWFAGLYLLKPLLIGVFAAFWIVTGLISLGPGFALGTTLMLESGAGPLSGPAVIAGALADIAIGLGILFRRTSRLALYGAVAISVFYALAATILVPQLWADPLGPILKILPILMLNLVALATLEDR